MLGFIYWQNANMAKTKSWPGFKGLSGQDDWIFSSWCFWFRVTETITIKLPRISDWNGDFSTKKPNSVKIPWRNEFKEKLDFVILSRLDSTLKKGSSGICFNIVNSVFVSGQYITYWIHFGYLPCRWNSDEEIWNISSKKERLYILYFSTRDNTKMSLFSNRWYFPTFLCPYMLYSRWGQIMNKFPISENYLCVMSFCVFVQYLISNLRCLTTFLTCVEKLTISEKFEFVQNIGFSLMYHKRAKKERILCILSCVWEILLGRVKM